MSETQEIHPGGTTRNARVAAQSESVRERHLRSLTVAGSGWVTWLLHWSPRNRCLLGLSATCVLLLGLNNSNVTLAQTPTDTDGTADVAGITDDQIAAARKAVDDDRSLEADAKKLAGEQLDTAAESLRAEQRYRVTLTLLKRDSAIAVEEVASIERELASTPPKFEPSDNIQSKEELQTEVSRVEAEATAATRARFVLEEEGDRRTTRRSALPQLIDKNQMALAEVQRQLAVKPPEDETATVTKARMLGLAARHQELLAESELLAQEGPLYEATGRLLTARRDRAARQEAEAARRLEAWKAKLAAAMRREAEEQATAARLAATKAHPALREIADWNSTLSDMNQTTVSDLEKATRDRDRVRQQTELLKADYDSLTQRAEAAQFTHAIGVLLRSHRVTLPDVGDVKDDIAERQPIISELNLQLIERERERRQLVDLESAVDSTLRTIRDTGTKGDELREQLQSLLASQRAVLGSLTQNQSNLLSTLVALDSSERQLIAEVDRQLDYIAEHVLWVRSTTALAPTNSSGAVAALSRALSGQQWSAVSSGLFADAQRRPLVWVIGIALVLILIPVRGRIRRRLTAIGRSSAKPNAIDFRPTVHAFLMTVLVAAPGPIIIWLLGWRMSQVRGADWLLRSLGTSLSTIAFPCFTLEIFRQVFRSNGLAVAHFGWDQPAVESVRRRFWYAMTIGIPLLAVIEFCRASDDTILHNTIGRVAFAVLAISLSVILSGIFKPGSALMESLRSDAQDAFGSRVKMFAGLAAIVAPVALGVAALTGYYYTALELGSKILATLCLVLGLFVARAVLSRWLLVSYRALAIRRNRERREAMQREVDEHGASDIVEPEHVPEFQLSDLNAQTGRLVRLASSVAMLCGLWFVWSDVLPALNILNRLSWEVTAPGVGVIGVVTLADVALSIATVIITLIAARNLPGLLEIAILQRLPMDDGARYAASTIIRYIIFVVGFVTAFGLVGIRWGSVQWLVAAMSVGLGFGLQEIFANFVSGIILLFERPVRVGDTVTVNDITGTVTRIRIRATTILDWNNKELIVPNRDFVTGNLVNWTLSNSNLRVIATVGIAYGSDTELATRLLYQVAAENPHVMKEPEPIVVFTAFGESSLDFELRCHVSTPQLYRTIAHSLNMAIDATFRKHNIEIAFPQRDLHLRSVDDGVLNGRKLALTGPGQN